MGQTFDVLATGGIIAPASDALEIVREFRYEDFKSRLS